jgi:hypothetical protein
MIFFQNEDVDVGDLQGVGGAGQLAGAGSPEVVLEVPLEDREEAFPEVEEEWVDSEVVVVVEQVVSEVVAGVAGVLVLEVGPAVGEVFEVHNAVSNRLHYILSSSLPRYGRDIMF